MEKIWRFQDGNLYVLYKLNNTNTWIKYIDYTTPAEAEMPINNTSFISNLFFGTWYAVINTNTPINKYLLILFNNSSLSNK